MVAPTKFNIKYFTQKLVSINSSHQSNGQYLTILSPFPDCNNRI
nr:hypothetical protein CJLB15_00104 [Campylobacter phage CJLB-15]